MSSSSDSIYPTEFQVSMSTFSGPSFKINLEENKLLYEKYEFIYIPSVSIEIQPIPKQWAEFWAKMEENGIWQWKKEYYNPVLDGTRWQINISGGNRTKLSSGLNGYPGSDDPEPSEEFRQFLAAVGELLGGIEIW